MRVLSFWVGRGGESQRAVRVWAGHVVAGRPCGRRALDSTLASEEHGQRRAEKGRWQELL